MTLKSCVELWLKIKNAFKSKIAAPYILKDKTLTIFSDSMTAIKVRRDEEGPYLEIERMNSNPQNLDLSGHYFRSIDEIDQFADTCKRLLKRAQQLDNV